MQPGGDPLVLCFVDFASPAHAATAMEALQGKICFSIILEMKAMSMYYVAFFLTYYAACKEVAFICSFLVVEYHQHKWAKEFFLYETSLYTCSSFDCQEYEIGWNDVCTFGFTVIKTNH